VSDIETMSILLFKSDCLNKSLPILPNPTSETFVIYIPYNYFYNILLQSSNNIAYKSNYENYNQNINDLIFGDTPTSELLEESHAKKIQILENL
jgi:hypothetical protein